MDITRENAVAACDAARQQNQRQYFSAEHWQCWGCMRFGGEPEKRCMHDAERGAWDACPIANRQLQR